MRGTSSVRRKRAVGIGHCISGGTLTDGLLDLLREGSKTATNRLIFPSPAHSKSPNTRPGGILNDKFLITCKTIALRAGLNINTTREYLKAIKASQARPKLNRGTLASLVNVPDSDRAESSEA